MEYLFINWDKLPKLFDRKTAESLTDRQFFIVAETYGHVFFTHEDLIFAFESDYFISHSFYFRIVPDPDYQIDLNFSNLRKGDLVEWLFGEKHPCIDYAIPQPVFDKLDSWGVDTFWFVWDYRENKIGGKLLSLSDMFYNKVKSIYDV